MEKRQKCIGELKKKLLFFFVFNFIFVFSGGKICMTDHFQPLWNRHVPRFGIAHALALGVRRKTFSVVFVNMKRFV